MSPDFTLPPLVMAVAEVDASRNTRNAAHVLSGVIRMKLMRRAVIHFVKIYTIPLYNGHASGTPAVFMKERITLRTV